MKIVNHFHYRINPLIVSVWLSYGRTRFDLHWQASPAVCATEGLECEPEIGEKGWRSHCPPKTQKGLSRKDVGLVGQTLMVGKKYWSLEGGFEVAKIIVVREMFGGGSGCSGRVLGRCSWGASGKCGRHTVCVHNLPRLGVMLQGFHGTPTDMSCDVLRGYAQ